MEAVSARNHLKGTIEEIQLGDVLAQRHSSRGGGRDRVGDHQGSAEEMALKQGDSVTAVVKATEVMIAKP